MVLHSIPHDIDTAPQNLSPDRGCDVSPKCTECPLQACRYDEPGILLRLRLNYRHKAILDARDAGKGKWDIVREFEISESTYHRICREAGKETHGTTTG